jgi:hypothetical protein
LEFLPARNGGNRVHFGGDLERSDSAELQESEEVKSKCGVCERVPQLRNALVWHQYLAYSEKLRGFRANGTLVRARVMASAAFDALP